MTFWTTARRVLLVVYIVVASVDVAGMATGTQLLDRIAKPLLMPLLAVWLLAGPAARRAPLVVSLAFAAGGDIALMFSGQPSFLVGMALFAGAHVAYVVAFVPLRPRPPWWVPTLYGVAWVALAAALYGRLSLPMLIGLACYCALLFTMASLAAGVAARLGVGALLFAGSDVLIGVGAAKLDFTGREVALMVLYVVGQAVLVTGYAMVTTWAGARAGTR